MQWVLKIEFVPSGGVGSDEMLGMPVQMLADSRGSLTSGVDCKWMRKVGESLSLTRCGG